MPSNNRKYPIDHPGVTATEGNHSLGTIPTHPHPPAPNAPKDGRSPILKAMEQQQHLLDKLGVAVDDLDSAFDLVCTPLTAEEEGIEAPGPPTPPAGLLVLELESHNRRLGRLIAGIRDIIKRAEC